jgi:hypothetical protein
VQVDPAQKRHARWTRCAFSGNPLTPPIVADVLGNLFNKEDLLKGLAAKAAGSPWPDSLMHIRLKELIPVQAQLNSSYKLYALLYVAAIKHELCSSSPCMMTDEAMIED